MDPAKGHDLAKLSTCTSCEFSEDFSKLEGCFWGGKIDGVLLADWFGGIGNYWTAVVYFRAKNGTFKRVPQRAQQGFDGTQGGMVC